MVDAYIYRRALFERSELVRPPQVGSLPHSMRLAGASVHAASRRARPLLAPFAETKEARVPGRNPASIGR